MKRRFENEAEKSTGGADCLSCGVGYGSARICGRYTRDITDAVSSMDTEFCSKHSVIS